MSINGSSSSFLPYTLSGLTDATFSNSNIGNGIATTLQVTTATPSKIARFDANQYLVSAVVDTSDLVPYSGATTTVNLNSQNITTTNVPTANPDLTNKLYVDSAISASNLLPLNNTWTGTNDFNNNFSAGKNAITATLTTTTWNQPYWTAGTGTATYSYNTGTTQGTAYGNIGVSSFTLNSTGLTAGYGQTYQMTITNMVFSTPSSGGVYFEIRQSGTVLYNSGFLSTYTSTTRTFNFAVQANGTSLSIIVYDFAGASSQPYFFFGTITLTALSTTISNPYVSGALQIGSASYPTPTAITAYGDMAITGATSITGIITATGIATGTPATTIGLNASNQLIKYTNPTSVFTGSVSAGYVPYASSANVFANSIISQSGGTLTITQSSTTVPAMTITSVAPDSAIDLNCTATSGRKYRVGSAGTGTGAGVGNFFVYDATAGLVRVVIDSSGKVGMGTITPSGQLNIVSSSADYTNSLVVNTAWPSITLDGSGTTGRSWSILNGASGAGVGQGNLGIYDITGGAYRLSINSSGYVGMGVDVSTQKLMVQGNVVSRGASTGGTLGTTSGNLVCLNSDDSYTYPTISTFNYQHDNQALLFDMYYAGNWYNSTGGFGWSIYKSGNNLNFYYMKSNGAGTASTPQLVMTMNTSGTVSIPQQPYVLLYGGGGGSIPYNNGDIYGASAGKAGYFSVGQSVGMSNVFGNGWYQALGTFYAPQTGKYQINLTMYWNSFVGGTRWSIQQYNSANTSVANRYCMIEGAGIGGDTIRQYSCMLYMTAGDYFFIKYVSGGGTSYAYFSGYEHSSMTIHMVS